MRVIPWEDSFNPEQQSLLVGSLLGDARLECRSKQGTARLRIHHADQQKDYVFWKYNLLKPLVLKPPWRTAWKDKRNGEIYVSWFFHTKTTAMLESWWRFFYPNGTKILPQSIGSLLDPLALAVWFMEETYDYTSDDRKKIRYWRLFDRTYSHRSVKGYPRND